MTSYVRIVKHRELRYSQAESSKGLLTVIITLNGLVKTLALGTSWSPSPRRRFAARELVTVTARGLGKSVVFYASRSRSAPHPPPARLRFLGRTTEGEYDE